MLNSRNGSLDYLSYEFQVKLYDEYCKGCPYSEYIIKKKTGRLLKLKDFDLMVSYITEHDVPVQRVCTFNDEVFSLKEITSNHCEFWNHPEQEEEGEFQMIEIEDLYVIKAQVSWMEAGF